jgi:hypothetical protein
MDAQTHWGAHWPGVPCARLDRPLFAGLAGFEAAAS